jgi:uncharacterized protein (TIGR03437 family)
MRTKGALQVVKNLSIAFCGLFLIGAGSMSIAAPRLSLTQTAFTVAVTPGSNGATQSLDAANLGDGSLNLQTSSSVTWLVATIGSAHQCSGGSATCNTVQIALQTSSLAKGTFTGIVTITDPNAVDAPQFVTVTALVGGTVPDKLEFFVPPSGSASSSFTTGSPVSTTVSNSPWLSIALNGLGTFKFNVPYKLTAAAASGMATGDYNGSVALSGSSFAPDNKTISVLLHVTTSPILQSSLAAVQFHIAQGANKQSTFIGTSNGGQGTLTVSTVTATAATGTWLSAQLVSGGALVSVTADPTGLSPNTYQGTVTIASNAANSSVVVPVQLIVEAQTPPVTFAGGVVNNGTFGGGESLAPGDIVAVFGDQFTFGDPLGASSIPLGSTLGGTQVLVNNQPAPLYFVSPGQVNFQVPFEAASGNGIVNVVRNSQKGNSVFVNIVNQAPRFILLNGGPYAIVTTPGGALTGNSASPARGGDVAVIYAIGLGPTSPFVASGVASPANPLANAAATKVCFGNPNPFGSVPCTDAGFSGLTPGLVGLYQVNVTIPNTLGSGNVPFFFTVNGVQSNSVQLALH